MHFCAPVAMLKRKSSVERCTFVHPEWRQVHFSAHLLPEQVHFCAPTFSRVRSGERYASLLLTHSLVHDNVGYLPSSEGRELPLAEIV